MHEYCVAQKYFHRRLACIFRFPCRSIIAAARCCICWNGCRVDRCTYLSYILLVAPKSTKNASSVKLWFCNLCSYFTASCRWHVITVGLTRRTRNDFFFFSINFWLLPVIVQRTMLLIVVCSWCCYRCCCCCCYLQMLLPSPLHPTPLPSPPIPCKRQIPSHLRWRVFISPRHGMWSTWLLTAIWPLSNENRRKQVQYVWWMFSFVISMHAASSSSSSSSPRRTMRKKSKKFEKPT